MSDKNTSTQLVEILKQCLVEVESDIEIKPATLAYMAMKKMDSDHLAPDLVSWAANLEMRQLARALLRKEFDPVDPDNPQIEMFEGLQPRYPTRRNSQSTYVRLEYCTTPELYICVERMGSALASLHKHQNALLAYIKTRPADKILSED